ncbi:MAG: outer membrane beta-barrel protein [Pedobacter sp.]
MKKLFVLICLAATVSLTTGIAMADSIKGRVGITGKIGILASADSDYDDKRIKPDVGLIGGGGFIYGIDDNFAAEVDVTRSEFGSDFPISGNAGDFGVTNVSFGGQYRFAVTNKKLVPYIGVGLDILLSEYDDQNGVSHDVDTTVGVHVTGGIDYFIYKQLALMVEAKALAAPETDIKYNSEKRGNFDPTSFSGVVGVRFFFN